MKTILAATAVIAFAFLASTFLASKLNAAPPVQDSTAEIVKAMNIQNQQLARIAASLERISGQQPGWKLPQ